MYGRVIGHDLRQVVAGNPVAPADLIDRGQVVRVGGQVEDHPQRVIRELGQVQRSSPPIGRSCKDIIAGRLTIPRAGE